jgi:hypothetical protein
MSGHAYGATGDAWRARLERFAQSGLAVVRFCAREGVSTASFYHWRKRLAPLGFRRRATGRPRSFQAVTVVPAVPGVSIHLPGGARIEVRTADLEAVRAVIAEVARADARLQTEGGSC